MTETRVTSIEKLLRASSSDEQTLSFAVPDAAFGFHAQQAVEKLMKALLVSRTGTHPFSHDLMSLSKALKKAGLILPLCGFPIKRLIEYAGNGVTTIPYRSAQTRGRSCGNAFHSSASLCCAK